MALKKYVLMAAGGMGNRMGSRLPKQFMEIAGKPVLLHTFYRFLSYAQDITFVLVLPEPYISKWNDLCKKYQFHTWHEVAVSGPTRFHSVKNGLKFIPDDSMVAIHDAARPLVSLDTISRVFHYTEKFGNAIPVVTPNESVRIVDSGLSKPLKREDLRLVQTPQGFIGARIKEAYNRNFHESFTDDASVLEAAGERLFLVEGNPENIKITTPADLIFAETYLLRTV